MKLTARLLPLFTLLLLVALQPPARAQVAGAPATIDYQGQMLDAAGNPLAPTTPTNYTMQFRIYALQSGGTPLWAESQIVTVDKGAFSVRLGTGVRIPAGGGGNEGTITDLRDAFNTTERYLGLTVITPPQAPAEITPRLAFLSSPFSLVAHRAFEANLVTQTTGTSQLSTATINNFTLAGPGRINGANVLEFGAGVAAKHADAGKMNYNTAAGSLDIIGAGTTGANRKVHIFAEGGLTINGPANAASFTGNGSGLTALHASALTTGTVPDSRLTTTVARRNTANTFTANQTINARLGIGNSNPPERLTVGTFGEAQNNYISVETDGGNQWRSGIRLRHFDANNGFTIESDERISPAGVLGLNFIENGAPAASRMVIKKGGNVGIGTTTPPERLSVGSFADQQNNYITVDTAGGDLRRSGIRLRHFDANNGFTIASDERISLPGVHGLNFIENPGISRMIIKKGGHVGIGTTAPLAPLHVGTSATRNLSGGWYFNGPGIAAFTSGGLGVCIKADGYVEAQGYHASSDARIKDITRRADSRADLETVQKLQVTDYRQKDRVTQGDALQKGFIAQEVQTLIPEAVTKASGYIPDIYAVADILKCAGPAGALSLRLEKAHGLKNGDTVRLITDDAVTEHAVTEIQDNHTFVVGGFTAEPKRVFVFGRKVDDFLSVDYNRIFTTGISAIQQIKKEKDEEVRALQEENAGLKARLAALEGVVTKLAARSDASGRDQSVKTASVSSH